MNCLKIKNYKLKIILILLFLLTPTLTEAAVLNRAPNNLGLVGYWPMNEGSGTQVGDMSGNKNHGAISGATWTSGKLSQALKFDGVDDYVDAGSASSLDNIETQGGGGMTVSFWTKPFSNATKTFISKGLAFNGNGNWSIGKNSTTDPARLNFTKEGATDMSTNWNSFFTTGVWTHVVVTWDGSMDVSGVKAYKNGVLNGQDFSTSGATGNSDASNNLHIGSGNGALFADTDMDEVRIYNRVLTAAQVAALYKAGSVRVGASSADLDDGSTLENGLVGHWTMDGKDTNWATGKANDVSGNGNHGNISGMSTTSSPVIGKLGQALKFDGVDDYVTVPHNDSLNPSEITISYWVKFASCPPNNNGSLIDKNYTAGYRIRLSTTCIPQFVFNGAPQVQGTAISLNTWTHVVLVGNSSGTRFYTNGVAGTLDTDPYVAGASTGSLLMAAGNTVINIPASLDDVRIYNRALTASEIAQLYKLGGDKVNASSADLDKGSTLENGLVGHWTMDGKDTNWATGKANDVSGNGNHGNISGMSTTSSPVIGKLGQALKFDGVDDYVNVGAPASLNLNNNYTLSAWVFLRSTTGNQGLLKVGNSAGSNSNLNSKYDIRMNGTTVQFATGDGTTGDTDVFIPASGYLNTWTLITCTLSSTNVKSCYKDGELISTATNDVDTSLMTPTVGFIGGLKNGASNMINANIDDVRIYNRALTASEVKQLYRMGR